MPQPFTGNDLAPNHDGELTTSTPVSTRDTPLLRTKLYVPQPRPEWVSRPRLLARLDETINRKLTLLSAPAGFGKTTLLCEWARSAPGRLAAPMEVAWLSLDEGDNDPARFWRYVIGALQTIPHYAKAGLGDAIPEQLQSHPLPSIEALLTGLINDIAAGRATGASGGHHKTTVPCVLILDDFHLIHEPQIHQALQFFLDNLPLPPEGIHLILAGRDDQALASLERALSQAEAEGYVRSFVDLGAPMARMLKQVARRGTAPGYAGKLLDAWAGSQGGSEGYQPHLPDTEAMSKISVAPLTEREQQVLHLLDTGLTGPEIAEELVISPGTYRTHTKNIYAKLGVHSRIEAVVRAREMNLL